MLPQTSTSPAALAARPVQLAPVGKPLGVRLCECALGLEGLDATIEAGAILSATSCLAWIAERVRTDLRHLIISVKRRVHVAPEV
jgi:hypothetical protein